MTNPTDEEPIYKYGVYMKPNGKLVSLENGNSNGRYHLFTGKISMSPLARAFGYSIDVGWCGSTLEWGPTAFIKKCEYLGEL